jgi:regulator of sigma D
MCLLFLLLICGSESAYTIAITQDYDKRDVYVFSGDEGKYLLLEFGDGELYLPLTTDLKAWNIIEDWKKRRDQVTGLFSLNEIERAKSFQEDIGFAEEKIDGKWGTGSWQQMAKWIMENKTDVTIAGYKFEIEAQEFGPPLKLPAYKETGEFFIDLQQWEEKYNAKRKLESAELPSKISFFSSKKLSGYLSWITKLKKDFYMNLNYPEKYFNDARIENDEILIERIDGVYPDEVTFPLKIKHKKFPAIEKSLSIVVSFPVKPPFQVIAEFFYKLTPFVTFLAFLILVILLIIYIKDRSKAEKCYQVLKGLNLSDKNEIKREIGTLYKTADFYRGFREDGKNIVDEISSKITDFETYVDKDRTWKSDNDYIVDILKKLSGIKKYVKKSREIEDHFLNFLMNVNMLLDPPAEAPSLTDDFKSGDKIKIVDMIYKKIEENKKKQEEKFEKFVNDIKEIFQPLADDEDFITFTDDKFWTELSTEEKNGCIKNLVRKIRTLEIRFPIRLKFIEGQLNRAALITEKILKPRSRSLREYKIVEDIDKLDDLLKKRYLWENESRPSWADQLPFYASEHKADEINRQLQDNFWQRVWDKERLEFSIQYIQSIIFKLKLILKGHSSIEESQTFKDANELVMAAEAVLFILQGIVLSCGKLYHVIGPGQKVSNDYVTPEKAYCLLRDRVYYDIYNKHSWHHRDVCDVSHWGLNEITLNAIKKIKDSRVVIHYDKGGTV